MYLKFISVFVLVFVTTACNTVASNIKYDGKGIFDTYTIRDGSKLPENNRLGYLAGSIGKVHTPLESAAFCQKCFIYIKKTGANKKLLTLQMDHGDFVNTRIDFKTSEIQGGVFYIPLEVGDYEVIGLEEIVVRPDGMVFLGPAGMHYTYKSVSTKNEKPFSLKFSIKRGQVTYIGQYILSGTMSYVVKDESKRDKKLISSLLDEKVSVFKESVPLISGSSLHYFKNVGDQFFQSLRKRRLELYREFQKKFIDSESEGA